MPKKVSIFLAILTAALTNSYGVVSQESKLDQCNFIPIALVYSSPSDYADREICLEGIIRYIHGEPYLAPAALSMDELFQFAIPISSESSIARFRDIRSGDTALITGYMSVSLDCILNMEGDQQSASDVVERCDNPSPIWIIPSDLIVTSRDVSDTHCLEVPIANLYASPLDYNETVVCTIGFLMAEDTQSSHDTTAIVPAGFEIDQIDVMSVELYLSSAVLEESGIRPGDVIHVRGRFGLAEGCYRQHRGDDMGEFEHFCWPVAAPLWISNPEFEVVN